MRFIVYRTSGSRVNDPKPCKKAVRCTYTRVDRRTTDDPAKIPAYLGEPTDWWYSDGTNHRVEKGEIIRDFPNQSAWCIEVETLEELMALYQKEGPLMIEAYLFNRDEPGIQIVDDYLC